MTIAPAALSIKDAAAYIGISRANLYRIMQSGKLRPAKVGGRTLIRRIDADAFLEAAIIGRRATTPPALPSPQATDIFQ
ncbi:helix-turn-helix domain-containing protein [Oryzifoliimicrobium ureilyticus]|uniref:helix-turn-helix domain-containing protein n=1 Tax=Oryzifoliimicrobium ureilyticus TaxID=3113724 RepID=UPI0030768816